MLNTLIKIQILNWSYVFESMTVFHAQRGQNVRSEVSVLKELSSPS